MLDELLQQAIASSDKSLVLSDNDCENLSVIIESACTFKNKSVLAVICTLLYKKIMSPEQDIRLHQAKMKGGFAGRTLDKQNVTPFLKKENFPHMSETGWLSRSLEQAVPYNLEYTGIIKPPLLKKAFLAVIDDIENGKSNARDCLLFIFRKLADWRTNNAEMQLAKPMNKQISDIIRLVRNHWDSSSAGVSKLPTLAIYATYKCLVPEVSKYHQCTLLPLLSHTSADSRTNRIGDIEVRSKDGYPFEAVEIKHQLPITSAMVKGLSEKIINAGVKTFYILSTKEEIAQNEIPKITELLLSFNQSHGCQVIVNGVASTLKYYLRLMTDSDKFIHEYVQQMETDSEISFELKREWNNLVD